MKEDSELFGDEVEEVPGDDDLEQLDDELSDLDAMDLAEDFDDALDLQQTLEADSQVNKAATTESEPRSSQQGDQVGGVD